MTFTLNHRPMSLQSTRCAGPVHATGHRPARPQQAARALLAAAVVGALIVALASLGTKAQAQAQTQAASTGISEISLERGCSGCATGSKLVVGRDGSATLTRVGNARHGTVDQTTRGRTTSAAFKALAQVVARHRFFALSDDYADPDVQDGPWSTLTVVRDGAHKQVFMRGDAAPPDALAIETAIDALTAQIFTPR